MASVDAEKAIQIEVARPASLRPAETATDASQLESAAPIRTAASEIPYTVFSPAKKKAICAAATFSALVSPLATNIYFPSLTIIADDLNVTVELVNITVTTYMILQGVAPTFWGTFADVCGRRPVYLTTILVFVLANLVLALQHSYAGLLIVRMLQSAGSSATIAIGTGTIADVTVQSERGTYMGMFSGTLMIAIAIAPIFGGVLTQAPYGWRSMFFFLFAASTLLLLLLFVLMPETGRDIVGNGSIPARGWNRTLIQILADRKKKDSTKSRPTKSRFGNPLRCLQLIMEKDVGIVLLANGLVYTSFYCVTVGFSSQMKVVHGLNTLQIGLCFLPYGLGCAIGSMVGGKFLDREFSRYAARAGYKDARTVRNDIEFPIERARLQIIWYNIALVAGDCIAFGWTFRENISIAVSLVLLFFNGFGCTNLFNNVSVLLMDLYPQESASITASNNFVRCLMGAAGSAVIDKVINAVGMGWAYVIVAVMALLATPLLLAEFFWGHGWRRARHEKLLRLKEKQEQTDNKREELKRDNATEEPGTVESDGISAP
ncbi:major facilitator superfamily domain-containing protein [Lipomyces arxii]|uniref:major facilitator superfamily domain-containing protein n=1 Tax=Lipomyces arxii TaxID=56418 RepID=UPI0034CF8528